MTLTVLFPAQAGVIPRASRPAVVFETVPRASGGNSIFLLWITKRRCCSPRKRG